jgi:pimeloyl-ACP methyl ester carboxylesterase
MRRAAQVAAWLAGFVALALAGLTLYDRAAAPPPPWLAQQGLEARDEVVDGRRLRYVRTGHGPAVVLVHGFGSSLYTWKDVIPGLAPDHDVLALDLPGFGLSDQPPDLKVDDLPRAVLGLMDRLGIQRAALVGNSLGGGVCVVVAARQPSRVDALVLVDAAGFDLGPSEQPAMVRLAMGPAGGLLFLLPGKRLVVQLALRQVFHDPGLVTPERVAEYQRAVSRPGTAAAIRSLGESLHDRASLVPDALARVRAPTLILWGRDDHWIPVADAERFHAALPGSRVVLIDDCGHVPQEERPAVVVKRLREFLAQAPGAEASDAIPTVAAEARVAGAE